jgi:hypothetical protein
MNDSPGSGARRCRRRFLRYFRRGFRDETYFDWERGYKERDHRQWQQRLDRPKFKTLLDQNAHATVGAEAVRIESRTNLLFSFEKMALRDAVKSAAGARAFTKGCTIFCTGRARPKKICQMVQSHRRFAASPDSRADLPAGDGVGLHRATRAPHFPQAQCDPARGGGLWV